MGKFRSKLKGQTKGKRWLKGQSSSSNPETTKYRDLAKTKFFQADLGFSNLTPAALNKHNAVQLWNINQFVMPESNNKMDDEEDNDTYSVSCDSNDSYASNMSQCTNMSYSRFLKVFQSDSLLHKEMLSILAAVTEVIKENGGSETNVEYYCCLLTTLERLLINFEPKEEQLAAVLSLLNMGIKHIPHAVLNSGFNQVTKMLLEVSTQYSKLGNNVIIKSVMGVLGAFLQAQEIVSWENPDVIQVFEFILNHFCLHSRPKYRKAAQHAVNLVVATIAEKNVPNQAADKVAEFCQLTLNACMESTNSVLVPNIHIGQTTILHTLGLIKSTLCYYSKSNMKNICETLLRLMTLSNSVITASCMQTLHSLFLLQKVVVPVKLNAQLITALYDYQPPQTDVQPMLAWLQVMQQAHIHLADADIDLCCAALPKLFTILSRLWLSEKTEIMTSTTHAFQNLFQDAVSAACVSGDLVQKHKPKLAKCFEIVESCLSCQYYNVWHQVLHIIKIMFEVSGSYCADMFYSCLKSLSQLRDSYKFSYNNELEHAVGAAVRFMGAEVVLNVIHLKKENGQLNIDRSWLLPVLKDNVRSSTLEFWSRAILPLAIYCQKHSVHLSQANDGIGAHSAELLHLQLWNLLPSFCNNPTDIKENFKNIAKVLGTAISERKELRLSVMASLRKLITSAKENFDSEDLQEMARFDKNYLPILFNVYTTKPIGSDEGGQRLAALDTIKVYLTIAHEELTKQLFDHALERLKTIGDDAFLKESLMDLIRALVPYQNFESITSLYNQCIKSLPEIKNNKEQKKAYRLLEDICGVNSEGCKEFVKNNRKLVQRLLMKSLESSAVSSKGARLRCLNLLIKAQPQLNHESNLIKTVIPEAVLCCKDINEKCRAGAYTLINTVGETLDKHNEMKQFLALVLAGLLGTPQIMSATILALASILHNFSGSLGQENIVLILQNISQLMTVPTREIVASCLSFIKVFCTTLPSPVVAASLPLLIKSLTQMTEDCKRHFRIKVRDILDRLVRKYGCESITPYVPATDTIMYKRLKNLRKLNARKKKQKETKKDEEMEQDNEEEFIINSKSKSVEEILADSDSEYEDIEEENPKILKNKKKSEIWIEDDEDSIVDFTDPTIRSKITTTKPGLSAAVAVEKKNEKDRGFKTSSDGRLIIEEQKDTDFEHVKTKSDDSDSEGNDAETIILSQCKRKRNDTSSTKSAFSAHTQTSMKYQAGGSGIHRKLSSASSLPGSEYKSKKAKGDIKKKGKLDPYAYLPLRRSNLNKRKRLKNVGQFKNLVEAAQSGAKKGLKAKRNIKKH